MKTNAWSFVLLAGSAAAAPSWGRPGNDNDNSWGSSTGSWGDNQGGDNGGWGEGQTGGWGNGQTGWGSSTTSSSAEVSSVSSSSSSSSSTSSVVTSSPVTSSTTYSVVSSSSSSVVTSPVTSSSKSSVVSSSTSSVVTSPVTSSSSSSSVITTSVSSSTSVHSTGVSSSSIHSTGLSSSSATSSAVQSSSTSSVRSTSVSSSSVHSTGASSSTSSAKSSAVQSSTTSSVHSTGASSSASKSSSAVSTGVKKSTSVASSSPVSKSTSQVTSTGETTTWVTDVTTIYTTICPVTATETKSKSHASGKPTGTSSVGPHSSPLTTSTVTSVYKTTITGVVTVTDVTTEYTTICPVTATETHGQTTVTSTSQSTSTVTSTYKTTIIVTSSPVAPVSSSTSRVAPVSSTSPVAPVSSATSPVSSAQVSPVSSITVTPVPVVSSQTSPVGPASSSPVEVTVTKVTTEYTTICPVTQTHINGQSTWTATYQSTSTVTSAFYTTVAVSTEASVSTVPWGSTTLTYAVTHPITFPAQSTSLPWNGGWGNATSSTTGAASGSASGSAVSRKHRSSSVSGKASVSGQATSKATSSATASVSGKPTGTKSVPSGSAVSTGPSTTSSTCTTPTPTEHCIPCEGQPGNDPHSWCGLTINDNSYKNTPKTCNVVEYHWTLTNTTIAPDGVERIGLLINGVFPGPLLEANWGDTVIVHVTNQLTDNGTTIHFHGTRQWYTNEMDGVSSITQCPLAPGQTQTYKFIASNYGTSWYHSHFGFQIYDGIFGPMVVHGPASLEYDEEQMITINDWNHVSVNEFYITSETISAPGSGPQALDTGLINGMNVWGADGSATQTGKRFSMTVQSGKSYRLRLLNSAIQSTFKFYIDQHTFQVIAADYVPIKPYEATILNINCGQRYDIVFKADQPVDNYWMRTDGQNECTTIKNNLDIKGIIKYEGAPDTLPTSTAYTYQSECVDEPLASLVPVVSLAAGPEDTEITENVLIGGNGGTPNLYRWTLSGTTFVSQWDSPTLEGIVANGSVPDWSGNLDIVVPNLGEWVYLIIESPIPVPHPIHLHGHDFMVLAQGYGSYDSSVPLNTASPARRDTALMPGNQGQAGYLVIAFETDNPGAWLLHCHIGWHSAMGLALQIIEGLGEIKKTVTDSCTLDDICDSWKAYVADTGYDAITIEAGI